MQHQVSALAGTTVILWPGSNYWVLGLFLIPTTMYCFTVLGKGNPLTDNSQGNTARSLRQCFCLELTDTTLEYRLRLLVAEQAPVAVPVTYWPDGLAAPCGRLNSWDSWLLSCPWVLPRYQPPTPSSLMHSIKLKFRLLSWGGVIKEKGKAHAK